MNRFEKRQKKFKRKLNNALKREEEEKREALKGREKSQVNFLTM